MVVDNASDSTKSSFEERLNHLLLDWIHSVATAFELLLDFLIVRVRNELLPLLESPLVVVLERANFEVSKNVFTEALDSLLRKLFQIISFFCLEFSFVSVLETSSDKGYSLQAAFDASPPEVEESLDKPC